MGVEPLFSICSPCWKMRFSRCFPLLSEVREPHRLLWAFESIPQMNLVLDEMQWSIVCVSLIGRSFCWPAQYAEINHISSVCPLWFLVYQMQVHTSLSLYCGTGQKSNALLCRMAALVCGSPSFIRACCFTICGGRPEIPLLVTQGTWIRQIAKPLDSDILERLAEAVSECWRLICNICVGVTLGFLF